MPFSAATIVLTPGQPNPKNVKLLPALGGLQTGAHYDFFNNALPVTLKAASRYDPGTYNLAPFIPPVVQPSSYGWFWDTAIKTARPLPPWVADYGVSPIHLDPGFTPQDVIPAKPRPRVAPLMADFVFEPIRLDPGFTPQDVSPPRPLTPQIAKYDPGSYALAPFIPPVVPLQNYGWFWDTAIRTRRPLPAWVADFVFEPVRLDRGFTPQDVAPPGRFTPLIAKYDPGTYALAPFIPPVPSTVSFGWFWDMALRPRVSPPPWVSDYTAFMPPLVSIRLVPIALLVTPSLTKGVPFPCDTLITVYDAQRSIQQETALTDVVVVPSKP